jgi:hypothetical protein
MRALSCLLFTGAAAATVGLAIAEQTHMMAAGAALVGALWPWMVLARTEARDEVRSVLLGGLVITLVVSPIPPLTATGLVSGALAGWHLARVASAVHGVAGTEHRRLARRQLFWLALILATALGFVAAALRGTPTLSFWAAAGLGAGALVLSSVWLVATRRASGPDEDRPSLEDR